jgi:hypothetical protein
MLTALLVPFFLERIVVFLVARPVRDLAWLAAVVPAKKRKLRSEVESLIWIQQSHRINQPHFYPTLPTPEIWHDGE